MNYSICTSSQTGNATMLAEKIRDTLDGNCIYFGKLDDEAKKADIMFVGFWTDQGCCDLQCKHFLNSLENKKVFLFGTCGFGIDPNYFDKVLQTSLKELNTSSKCIGTFMCQGKMRQSVLDRYEKMKASNTNIPNIDMLIDNFHKALTHPDANDLNDLEKKIKNINF